MPEKIIDYSGFKQEKKDNRSIRLKITEKCPWECKFCHEEGGWGIDDVKWEAELVDKISKLKEALNIQEIHLTGGEPTLSKYVEELSAGLSSLGLDVKLTTNGQFGEKKLRDLIQGGVKEFNFSVHALNPEDFIKAQKNEDLSWASNNIENQKRIIAKAQELGAKIKLNILVGTDDDVPKALEVFEFAKAKKIPLRFLNDLYNGQASINAIEKMARGLLNGDKFKETVAKASSSKSSYYRDKDGYEFGVKEIREYKLETLCADCKAACVEQFYGIRLEQREGIFYVRLCIDRKDGKSLMTVEEFLNSDYLKEINKLLNE